MRYLTMEVDIKAKDFYLNFIYNATEDIKKYEHKILELDLNINHSHNYLSDNIDNYKQYFNLDLTKYDEFNNKEYNKGQALYQQLLKLYDRSKSEDYKKYIIQGVKYCNLLNAKYKVLRLIELARRRKSITWQDYRQIIYNYYCKVHKCVLEGYGYRYCGGLGTLIIGYWKSFSKKRKIDYRKTSIRKKELLEKGIKLFDQKEKEWYDAHNIPYDGVDYRIYKDTTHHYVFEFINTNCVRYAPMQFKHTEYVSSKYKGKSATEIANEFIKDIEDIYNIQLDLGFKLNILLYLYPNKYLNFIRNVEQDHIEFRKNHR